MCGVVGVFSGTQRVSHDSISAATRALHHRGPDGRRQWIAPHGNVGLGHARLSIIDLSTGDQPIANEDGSIHIVVNGEFYDFERIQKELAERGHQLRTRSDSEILVHLYEDFGTNCMPHLRGEFAFIVWDENNGALFAARDRFGIKPLYYAWHDGALYLASEIKALFAAGVPARWDRESIYQEMHLVADEDRTLFRGVYQVPPGHFLFATRYQTQLVRYWDQRFPLAGAEPSASDEEYIERFRSTLLEATRLRLRADVPVGCYLSGGIDSCALLGMASSLRSDPIEAFTIAFEEGPFDESPVAEEMARRAGANYHCFRMPEAMLADHYADAVRQCETLHFNSNHVAKYLLSRKVQEHGFKVVLTGEGSDEILAGYPPFRRDFVLHSSGSAGEAVEQRLDELKQATSQSVNRMLMPTGGDSLSTEGVRRVLGFVPTFMETQALRGFRSRALLAADFAAEFSGRDPYLMFLNRFNVAGGLAGRAPVNQSMYLWSRSVFCNKLLNFLADRMEMAHSIEGRVPFLDHNVVELANQMPVTMKIRGITEKYVLREAARPFLTDTVYKRQKHPFFAPFEPKGKLAQLVQDTLRGPTLQHLPFFDQKAVIDRLDGLSAEDDADERSRVFGTMLQITSACVLQQGYRPEG